LIFFFTTKMNKTIHIDLGARRIPQNCSGPPSFLWSVAIRQLKSQVLKRCGNHWKISHSQTN